MFSTSNPGQLQAAQSGEIEMAADIVQAQYEELEAFAARFGQSAAATETLRQRVERSVHVLEQGGWQGRGAAAFFTEMTRDIYPIMQRLAEAFEMAQSVTLEIKMAIQEAEEEAAKAFVGQEDGLGSSGSNEAGGVVGSGGPTNAAQPAQEIETTGDRPSRELVVNDPSTIFTESYMENFIGSHFQGEDSPRLNQLMEELLHSDPSDWTRVNSLLDQIADMRGVDRETFHEQYETYLNLHHNATSKGAIDLSRHPDFMGSTASLRYGKVVGDVFGIDPVFGALLNPTGGLVGSADDSYEPGDNDAIGYHGIFHDAAGYLYNHQDKVGPGYDYLGREPFPTSNPLTGQLGGISWWAAHPNLSADVLPNLVPDIPYVPAFAEQGIANLIEDGPIAVVRQGIYVVEGGKDMVQGAGDIVRGNFSKGWDSVVDGGQTIVEGTARNAIDLITRNPIVGGAKALAGELFDLL